MGCASKVRASLREYTLSYNASEFCISPACLQPAIHFNLFLKMDSIVEDVAMDVYHDIPLDTTFKTRYFAFFAGVFYASQSLNTPILDEHSIG